MRLVKVKTPTGQGIVVAELALALGIKEVAVSQIMVYTEHGQPQSKDSVDIEVSTPQAKAFVEALQAAPFFDQQTYSVSLREPRSILSHRSPSALTWPVVIPEADVRMELWQLSHITLSFLLRLLIAGMLLAYGMLHLNLLLMIAGLLFLPFLPLLLGMAVGIRQHDWALVRQACAALVVEVGLVVVGSVVVALLSTGPLQFQQWSPLPVGFLISAGVGVAAALAISDDAGRRELIGLAATAQTALVPAWFGIALVRGFKAATSTGTPAERMIGLLVNLVTILVCALCTFSVLQRRSNRR